MLIPRAPRPRSSVHVSLKVICRQTLYLAHAVNPDTVRWLMGCTSLPDKDLRININIRPNSEWRPTAELLKKAALWKRHPAIAKRLREPPPVVSDVFDGSNYCVKAFSFGAEGEALTIRCVGYGHSLGDIQDIVGLIERPNGLVFVGPMDGDPGSRLLSLCQSQLRIGHTVVVHVQPWNHPVVSSWMLLTSGIQAKVTTIPVWRAGVRLPNELSDVECSSLELLLVMSLSKSKNALEVRARGAKYA
jgi:hypothetical protein